MKTKALELALIHCDSGTQSRLSINDGVVAEYAEQMTSGDSFPPMDVFFDGTDYHLAGGFHRYMAARRIGVEKFECLVHTGTATDALWFALGANKANGCRMSPGDKRMAIEIALCKFPDKTQEQIAAHVGCSQQYVARMQAELTTSSKLTIPATRKGKDGKSRPTKYKTDASPEKISAIDIRAAIEESKKPVKSTDPEEHEPAHIAADREGIQVCIDDLRIALEKIESNNAEPGVLLAIAEDLDRVGRILRKLAKGY